MRQGTIGTDESGKGDYFGPLVVAGVIVRPGQEEELVRIGVRDSKLVADARARALASAIRERTLCEVVVIGPVRYNQMYARIGNMNRILAWAHARVIENLLLRMPCDEAISDQFGDRHFLEEALMRKGKSVRLVQKPRAESEPPVAAASIVARAEFLRRLASLSRQFRVNLPKGAGKEVIEAAVAFVGAHGKEALAQVAKLHFKTTGAVLGAASRA